MSPNELARRKAFWSGLLVSVGFRVFAYGFLWFVFSFVASHPASFVRWSRVLTPVERFVGNAAVVSVPLPFITGFLSGYFWRRLELREYMKGIWWGAIFFFVLLGWVLVGVGWGEYIFFEMIFGFLDVTLCLMGAATGCEFWKSRLGRQFLGDFSTRYEAEYHNIFDSSRKE